MHAFGNEWINVSPCRPLQILQGNNTKNLIIKFNELQLICEPMLTFILEPSDIFYLFSLLYAPARSYYIYT